MEINEIVESLKYYTGELPKEALAEAINKKEEITPKLLEMLEYTKENLNRICYGEDDFFGYIYAIFLLAQFKEKKAFPYLIDLLHKDDEKVEYILGDDFTDYLPRLLASTYNGDDEALFSLIENEEIDEYTRSNCLQTFAILYLYGVKDRKFIVDYFKKLIEEKDEEYNYLYEEIIEETAILRLIELKGTIEKIYDCASDDFELTELEDNFNNENYKINRYIYPFKPFYEYIDNVIDIMDEWACFGEEEDKEYENSEEYKKFKEVVHNRIEEREKLKNTKRNDKCPCGSGKKFKQCCLKKYEVYANYFEFLKFVDYDNSKAQWYFKKGKNKKAISSLKQSINFVKLICLDNDIKSIDEYDSMFKGYETFANSIKEYEKALKDSNEIDKLYNLIDFYENLEKTFDLDGETNKHWKEFCEKGKKEVKLKIENMEKVTE